MKVRMATANEWPKLQELNEELFLFEKRNSEESLFTKFPYTDRAKEYYCNASAHRNNLSAYICEDDDKIIAYAIIKHIPSIETLYRSDVILYEISTICVTEKKRREGVGSFFIKHIIEKIRSLGGTHLQVTAFARNQGALDFYRDAGFKDFQMTLELDLEQ